MSEVEWHGRGVCCSGRVIQKGRVYTFFWKIGEERDKGSAFCRVVWVKKKGSVIV